MILPESLIDHSDGEIRLAGHRIGLYDVINLHQQGHSPENIRAEYPTLPLAVIRKVIAFYLQNQAEVDAYVAAYRAELERQEAASVPGCNAVRMRQLWKILQEAEAKNAGDPNWAKLTITEKIERISVVNPSQSD